MRAKENETTYLIMYKHNWLCDNLKNLTTLTTCIENYEFLLYSHLLVFYILQIAIEQNSWSLPKKIILDPKPCKTSQISGLCTVVSKCDIALAALSKGKLHHLRRCGFTDEQEEIVCCPTLNIIQLVEATTKESTTQGTDQRVNSKRKCERGE